MTSFFLLGIACELFRILGDELRFNSLARASRRGGAYPGEVPRVQRKQKTASQLLINTSKIFS